jgi:hypothetical protein
MSMVPPRESAARMGSSMGASVSSLLTQQYHAGRRGP